MVCTIVDETTDVSVKEQVSICLRHVDDEFKVNEDFIGYYETGKTDSETLVQLILDALVRLDLSIANCRGQCYDGAANMAGRFSGVKTRLLAHCSKALYVHCCAHSLNLALQSTRCYSISSSCAEHVRLC